MMTRRFLFFVAALAAAFAMPAGAASEHESHHPAAAAAAENKLVDGVVRKIDTPAGKLTLAHGPLTHLGMPAMTMAFSVKDSKILKTVKEGDRVRFLADRVDGAFVVVRLEPATPK